MISDQAKRARRVPRVSGGIAYRSAKRLIDVMASAAGLLLLLPIFAAIAVAIKWYSPGPVLYGSTRIGRGRVPFRMWKFRTMVPGADRLGGSVTTDWDPRVTPIGRILRHSKLDELPSLWNVLAGEMTLVGPRPETPAWVKHYTPEMARVLETRPGVTDVTQILFRHEERMLKSAAVDEGQYMAVMRWKVALQLEYLCRRSLVSDVKLLLHTVFAILDQAPDVELEQLVAHASIYESGSLPLLPAAARGENLGADRWRGRFGGGCRTQNLSWRSARWSRWRPHVVNYTNDFVILSRGHADEALAWTRRVMTTLGLNCERSEDYHSLRMAAGRLQFGQPPLNSAH